MYTYFNQRRQWQPPPVLLPGKSHGWRSLVATVHGVARNRTRLNNFTFTFHFHALEKEMATHSSVLAWRIPGTTEPGGLLSMGSHRVGHDWRDLAAAAAVHILYQLNHLVSKILNLLIFNVYVALQADSSYEYYIYINYTYKNKITCNI